MGCGGRKEWLYQNPSSDKHALLLSRDLCLDEASKRCMLESSDRMCSGLPKQWLRIFPFQRFDQQSKSSRLLNRSALGSLTPSSL